MKLKKYLTDKADPKRIGAKLLSYSAMGAALLGAGSDLSAQCADATNPVIGVDIDGDGTDDIQLNFVSYFTTLSIATTLITGPTQNLVFGTSSTGLVLSNSGTGSINGCSYQSFLGGQYNGAPDIAGTYATSFQVYYSGIQYYYFTFIGASVSYGLVSALGSNQIIGLTGTGASVCSLIDSSAGVSGAGTASSVGLNVSYYYYFFNQYQFQSVQVCNNFLLNITAGPTSTCTTSAAGTLTFPGIITGTVPLTSCNFYVGPYGSAPVTSAFTNPGFSTAPLGALAVQFDVAGETHNGWVTLSFAGGQVCVDATDYNTCSIETATMGGDPSQSCITVGAPAPAPGPACLTLPVTLVDFSALLNKDRTVSIDWTTSNEIDNDHFMVERSTNGTDWSSVAKVEGNGSSNRDIDYTALDAYPNVGINYYRLKQVDFNGLANFSEVKSIEVDRDTRFSVSPNPASDLIRVVGEVSGTVRIFDVMGKEVSYHQKLNGKVDIKIGNYPEGVYYVKLFDEHNNLDSSKKIIKMD